MSDHQPRHLIALPEETASSSPGRRRRNCSSVRGLSAGDGPESDLARITDLGLRMELDLGVTEFGPFYHPDAVCAGLVDPAAWGRLERRLMVGKRLATEILREEKLRLRAPPVTSADKSCRCGFGDAFELGVYFLVPLGQEPGDARVLEQRGDIARPKDQLQVFGPV